MPAPYIDRLHELGDCYADARRNAVFVCRDEDGRAVGAELKGTVPRRDGSRFTGMAPGSRKDRGGFRVGTVARAAVVYLVESAIDAISLTRLRQMDGEKGFAVVSTAGTTPEPRTWFAGLADAVRRVCAFDNDPAGDKAAQALRRHRFERLRPEGKDWNDDLRARRAAAGGRGSSPHDESQAFKHYSAHRRRRAARAAARATGANDGRGTRTLTFLSGEISGGRAAKPRGGRQPPESPAEQVSYYNGILPNLSLAKIPL